MERKKLKNKDLPEEFKRDFIYFLGAKINLTKRPFIPREETKFWVKKVIKEIKKEVLKKKVLKILDLFSGSGCIGIAILKNLESQKIKVHFGEKYKKFLDQIKFNLKLNQIPKDRYLIIKTNLFKNIKQKYDFILANPPYCDPKKINWFEPSVLKFEPHEALFGKKEGLFFIKKIIKEAKDYLKKEGKIYLEFSQEQKEKIEKILKKHPSFYYQFFKDQFSKWRYLKIVQRSLF